MFYLECVSPVKGVRFPLRRGVNIVGRAPTSEVMVADPSLSRRHVQLTVDGRTVRARDLGSHNGTRLQGAPLVAEADLQVGDTLFCGDVVFVLVEEGEVARPAAPPIDPSGTVVLDRPPELSADPAARRLAVLLRVGELLARPGQGDQLQARILSLAAEILPIDRAALVAVTPDGALRIAASRGVRPTDPRPYSESIVRYVIEHRVAASFDDAQADHRLGGAASVVVQDIRCAMCAPLIADDRVLGAIYVDNQVLAHSFVAGDLDLLAGFANQAALAMSNAALQDLLRSAAVRQHTFERFFPPATAARLLESGGELGVQELEVTVLFSDISGFTELSSTLPPADVVALLHTYFPPMAKIVFSKEGTLEKYIGDALLAVWGAPYGHPDDADRALGAAIEMQEAVVRMRERLPRPIDVHIGLHSGVVALANIGSAEYVQVATIGDATNTAARVCGVAEPGEIVITRETADRLTRADWPLVALPPARVKGKAEPLALYRVAWRGR